MELTPEQVCAAAEYLADGYYAALDRMPLCIYMLELEGEMVAIERAGLATPEDIAVGRKLGLDALRFGYDRGLKDMEADPLLAQNWRCQ